MAPCKLRVKAARHLICDSCDNWVDFAKSRCDESWAEVQADSFSFECWGVKKIKGGEEWTEAATFVIDGIGRGWFFQWFRWWGSG